MNEHKINDYRFGQIVIDEKKYTSDLKIFPECVRANWRRAEGHKLALIDIEDILTAQPEVLIIGTGSAGIMSVPENVQKRIEDKGIKLIVQKTDEACINYNQMNASQKVIAALHLTC